MRGDALGAIDDIDIVARVALTAERGRPGTAHVASIADRLGSALAAR
jgi:hypothetical protein